MPRETISAGLIFESILNQQAKRVSTWNKDTRLKGKVDKREG